MTKKESLFWNVDLDFEINLSHLASKRNRIENQNKRQMSAMK